jgi:AcrR family transcriptional regulator
MKKENIIKTAMKLFVKQGFENTPTSQISKEANVATGTLFHHFKTKEELINEVYIYVKKSMASAIFQNVKGSTKEQVKVIWTEMVKWSFVNPDESQFLEKFYGSSYINNLTVEQMESHFEKGGKVFHNAVKEKLIKDMPMELFSNITFGLLHAFEKEFYKKKELDKKLLEKSFDMYWGLLKK